MDTIFGSVIYPNAFEYAFVFLDSLKRQTYKDFSLLLLNDSVSNDALAQLMKSYDNNYEIVGYADNMTPSELRIRLIEEAKLRECKYLVLGDIDDYFSENRVERSIRSLCSNADVGFVYNRLLLTDGSYGMPKLPTSVTSVKDILEYNFLGLSNTAINIQGVDAPFIKELSECRSQVFDWYLFSKLVLFGQYGKYVPDTVTYYRLYEDNYAGIPKMTQPMLDKEIYVKKEHYRTLSPYDETYRKMFEAYLSGDYEINEQLKYYWWNLTRRKQK